MEDFKNFLINFRGAIIGGLIAFIALLLNLHTVLLWILIIVAGILIGNYVQHNKEFVKDKLKSYIDKL